MIDKKLAIWEFLKHVRDNLGNHVIGRLFKSENENSFCSKICSIEDGYLVETYLEAASKWMEKSENLKSSFDKFEKDLMESALNELISNQCHLKVPIFEKSPINMETYNSDFMEYFALHGLNHFLNPDNQADSFVERLLPIISHAIFKRFRTFFEYNLECEKIKRIINLPSNILLKHCQEQNFQTSIFNVSLQEKNIETFKFLIRSLTDEIANEIIGKTLCYHFKECKDELRILNVITSIKGQRFMEILLQSKFILREKIEETSLLFSSMNFNRNCLNLVEFCFKNFYSGDKSSFEKIFLSRDNQDLNFYQKITKSIQNDSEKERNSKLFSKVVLRFNENGASSKFEFLPHLLTAYDEKYKQEVLKAFVVWSKLCKDNDKIYSEFKNVLKDSAFQELSLRKNHSEYYNIPVKNLLALESFSLDFLEHYASSYMMENLKNESFLRKLFNPQGKMGASI
jgi:hypothetical protein